MIPDFQTLMLPLLRAAESGEIRLRDAVKTLAEELGLTDDERNKRISSGTSTVFYDRVGWARLYLTKAALLHVTRRGHFEITDRGRKVLSEAPERIDIAYLSQFAEFQEFRQRSPDTRNGNEAVLTVAPLSDAGTPDEIMRAASRSADGVLRTEILERIHAAPPEFFEQLMVTLLVRMGYGGSAENPGRALGRSSDGGVDGVIDQDALGLDRVYIQAKRYARGQAVGSGAIRDFFGALDMHQATKGVFATTASFTKDAHETAKKLSQRIVLIDGDRLADLMIRNDVGVRVEETLHLKKIDEDFFPE